MTLAEEVVHDVEGHRLPIVRLAMKISYDPEVDALRIVFRETTTTTRHLAEGIAGDYDAEGRLAGLEVLDAVKRFGSEETLRQVVLEGIGPGR